MKLPSGIELALIPIDLFDHKGNWFAAKPNHFWCWMPDNQISKPPFEPGEEVFTDPVQLPVPITLYEAMSCTRVLEHHGPNLIWRGEMLHTFPKYRALSAEDQAAWEIWKHSPEVRNWLHNLIDKCRDLADRTEADIEPSPARTPDDLQQRDHFMSKFGLPRMPIFEEDPEYARCLRAVEENTSLSKEDTGQ